MSNAALLPRKVTLKGVEKWDQALRRRIFESFAEARALGAHVSRRIGALGAKFSVTIKFNKMNQ